MTTQGNNRKTNDSDRWLDLPRIREGFSANFASCPTTVIVLCTAIIFGFIEFLLWGRTHLEDGIPLLLLLSLASFHFLTTPLDSKPSRASRIHAGVSLLLACLFMVNGFLSRVGGTSQQLTPLLWKNGSLFLLAIAILQRQDGVPAAWKALPLLLLAIVILPLYELLLLEFSYPLRLLSTVVSVILLRLFGFDVNYDGTSLFWNNQTLSVTEACSGIALLSLFFLIEYILVHPEKTATWKKWAWSSLLLLWVILGNALRLLLTFLLYLVWGDKVFAPRPHFLLGCFFVVITSLMIWFSSFLFKLDRPPSSES